MLLNKRPFKKKFIKLVSVEVKVLKKKNSLIPQVVVVDVVDLVIAAAVDVVDLVTVEAEAVVASVTVEDVVALATVEDVVAASVEEIEVVEETEEVVVVPTDPEVEIVVIEETGRTKLSCIKVACGGGNGTRYNGKI